MSPVLLVPKELSRPDVGFGWGSRLVRRDECVEWPRAVPGRVVLLGSFGFRFVFRGREPAA